jgi:predicted enzyme related to lactoylglutathione lyase
VAKVLGVGGVFFKSSDPKRLAGWYARCLGFEIDSEAHFAFDPATMPKNARTVWSAFNAETKYFAPSNQAFMINLVVDDLEQALEQVRQGGGQIVGDAQHYDYGSFGWFLDPDGNKVELWQPSSD